MLDYLRLELNIIDVHVCLKAKSNFMSLCHNFLSKITCFHFVLKILFKQETFRSICIKHFHLKCEDLENFSVTCYIPTQVDN